MSNLLTDIVLTSSDTFGGTFADITGMSDTVAIAGTGSVVILMTSNIPVLSGGGGGDACAEYRFTVDGSPVGPELSASADTSSEYSGREIIFAVDGLSTGNHTFAVQARNRSGTVDTSSDPRTFQVVEIESGASLIVDVSATDTDTSSATFADVSGLSATVTPNAGSVLLMLAGVTIDDPTNTDQSANFRFAIDGTRDGPFSMSQADNTDEMDSASMAWAVDGVSAASHTFSVQWQEGQGTPDTDNGRTRILQVIEFESDVDLLVDNISVTAEAAPAAFADMDDMTGSPDIDSVDSIALVLANYVQDAGGTADKRADSRLTVGGVFEGAIQSQFRDFTDRTASTLMARGFTGESGVTDFAMQWLNGKADPDTDTGRQRTFQVLDLKFAVDNDLAAALDIVLSVAADLDAQGKLDAALNIVLAQAADLKAAGRLDATLPIILSVIADLKGAGELTAVQSIVLTIAADLTAVGSLNAAALIALTVAADLDAIGEIQAALAIVLNVAAELDAPGTLSAALGIVLTVVADLTAAGELEAAASIILTVVADLTEADRIDLQAALDIVLTVAADLDAEGRLDAALNIVLNQAADLTAAGRLEAALPIILQVIADLKGAGELTAAQSIVLTVAADITAVGSLQAALNIVLTVAADLDAEGRLDAALNIVLTQAADLTAAGRLDAALSIIVSVIADLRAVGELTADQSIVLTVAADLTAIGSLDATLDIVLAVAADLDAVGQLTANMQIVLAMAADLKAAGELRAALAIVLTLVAAFSIAGELEAALLIRVTIVADLTEAAPEAPIVGGSPGAPPGVPTIALTEQQVVQRQLLREDDEAMSVVLTALGLIRK